MEKAKDCEQKTLINELTQGRELANQLKSHLDTTSPETCEFLIEKILSSYEKALSMLNWSALVASTLESPHSLVDCSPRSENSDQDCKDQSQKDVFKKRKMMPRWSQQVRVCSGTGCEGSLDDGCSWRKYGQKDILGANFPRAYYRCTHRNAQGCLATKQVQKSDEDPSIFEITYRGRHTCIQASHLTAALASLGKEGTNQKKDQEEEEIQRKSQQIFFNFGTDLKTEDLGTNEDIFPSFSFPTTPIESENVESHFFQESMMENNFMGNYSPPFISPATSESNYFSQMNNFGMGHDFLSLESDLAEIISAPTSVTNSPIGDLDFSLDEVNFELFH